VGPWIREGRRAVGSWNLGRLRAVGSPDEPRTPERAYGTVRKGRKGTTLSKEGTRHEKVSAMDIQSIII